MFEDNIMNELRLAYADKRSNFRPDNFFQEFSLHVDSAASRM